MAPGARAVLVENVVAHGNALDRAKFGDLSMLVLLGGQNRTANEFAALYRVAGFQLTRVLPIATGLRLIEGQPT
jgi:hypothetical protein